MQSVYDHPNPFLNRLSQYGAALLLLLMGLSSLGLILLGVVDARLRLLAFAGLILIILIPPVIMLTTITPPLTVAPDGLTIRPTIWRSRRVPWSNVRAVKPYPLLPPSDSEVGRRLMVGKRRYRPAEGYMLLIPSLPLYYKFNGFFCGEGFTPVIAFTNRSHIDYDKLLKQVQTHTGEAKA